jgi:hypothetical protein
MPPRNISNKHELPPNPTYKSFERSDGDPNTWPRNTERVVDHEGHVNFMDPISIDMAMAIKWRVQVGEALANALKWPSESTAYRILHQMSNDISQKDLLMFSRTGRKATPCLITTKAHKRLLVMISISLVGLS